MVVKTPLPERVSALEAEFKRNYGDAPELVVRAPGRVNGNPDKER